MGANLEKNAGGMDNENDAYPHVDVDVRPDQYKEDFLKVLEKIRPEWKAEDVVYDESKIEASKGLLNLMVRCHLKEVPEDSIMMRVHNTKMSAWLDRSVEARCIQHLHELDCAPRVLATFKTGFCYEFIHGEVLNNLRLHEEPIWRQVAEELAKIHAGTIEDGKTLIRSSPNFEEMFSKMWDGYPTELKDPVKNERFQKELPPREILEKEIKMAIEHALSFNPDVVLCHNDTRAENIIWNQDTGRAHFVDFEAMNYSYRAADISNHFERYAGLTPPDYSLLPDEEFQLKWIRVYLEKHYEVTGRSRDDVTDKDVRTLYVQVKKFRMVFLIAFGAGGPVFENLNVVSSDLIDMLGCSIISVNEYFKKKDELHAIQLPE